MKITFQNRHLYSLHYFTYSPTLFTPLHLDYYENRTLKCRFLFFIELVRVCTDKLEISFY